MQSIAWATKVPARESPPTLRPGIPEVGGAAGPFDPPKVRGASTGRKQEWGAYLRRDKRRAREGEEWDDAHMEGFRGQASCTVLHPFTSILCCTECTIHSVLPYILSCTLPTTPHTVFCFESLKVDLARASGREMTLLQARIDALKMNKFHHYDE